MQIAPATPAATRPDLPAQLRGGRQVGERIASTLSSTMRTLNDGLPYFKQGHVPTTAQLDDAIAVVRGLEAPIAGLVATAEAVLGDGGSHRAWIGGEYGMGRAVLSGPQQRAQVDAVARTLFEPRELPVGIITALLGAPVFGYLLWRRRAVS